MGVIYLEKDGNQVVSHCACESELIASPRQMDCPWCGCGWLFSCIECRKAFTFARAVEVEHSWEELAVRDLRGRCGQEPAAKEVAEWVRLMQGMLADVELGRRYVYFDGAFVPADLRGVTLDGWFAFHDLDLLPHVEATLESKWIDDVLGSAEYWRAHQHEED